MSGTDLTTQDERALAILESQKAEYEGERLQTPILKLAQGLTTEVDAGLARPGQFINSLTGEVYDDLEFIAAYYHKGRSARAPKTNRYFVGPFDIIPDHWKDLVGPDWIGQRFDDHPDAEERFKTAVNAGDREWGHGPLISTTHNFTGLIVVQSPDPDEDAELHPVRLSLQRTNRKAADKMNTIIRTALRGVSWNAMFELDTEKSKSGPNYLLTVKMGRRTTSDERLAAIELATAVTQGRVEADDEADVDRPVAASTPEDAVAI